MEDGVLARCGIGRRDRASVVRCTGQKTRGRRPEQHKMPPIFCDSKRSRALWHRTDRAAHNPCTRLITHCKRFAHTDLGSRGLSAPPKAVRGSSVPVGLTICLYNGKYSDSVNPFRGVNLGLLHPCLEWFRSGLAVIWSPRLMPRGPDRDPVSSVRIRRAATIDPDHHNAAIENGRIDRWR